ncbi:MAG: lipoate--protein ligase family protein [Anaerolineaceae bacterium]|nr:lipoate--protein ligase family protein [Anaerolineaceae bacterium]
MIINEVVPGTAPRQYNQHPIMENRPSTWRLICHPQANGAWNMAVDETLLEKVIAGDSPPVLRLYAWQPACLSLGQAQPVADVDRAQLDQNGWDLVRRPTGGRAILHADELTYAVIAPVSEPSVRGTLLESYLKLSQPLTNALAILGLQVNALKNPDSNQAARSHNPVCFEEPSNYEIFFKGKKVIGSAQARRGNAFLQHGALPLTGDLTRITQVLSHRDETARQAAAEKLNARATTLSDALGRVRTWDEAAQAFRQAFCQALGIHFQEDDLTAEERSLVEVFLLQKYGSDTWTLRV